MDSWKRVQRHRHIAPFLGVAVGLDYLPSLVLPFNQNGNINDYLASNPEANILHLVRFTLYIFRASLIPTELRSDQWRSRRPRLHA